MLCMFLLMCIHGSYSLFPFILQDLELLSQELVRFSKGTDPAQDPKATG